MLGAMGVGLSGAGGVASTIGGAKSDKKKKKQLQQAMNTFQKGSTDAQGNKINYNADRGWGFDLNQSGKAASNAANIGQLNMAANANVRPSALKSAMTGRDYKNSSDQAMANQRAAMKQGLRTGADTGQIARSYGQLGSSNLQRALANNRALGPQASAQRASQYAQLAQHQAQPIQNIQSNLQNLHSDLGGLQLGQANKIASIQPANGLQQMGSIMQGVGSAVSGYDNQQKQMAQLQQRRADQQKQNQQIMDFLSKIYGV